MVKKSCLAESVLCVLVVAGRIFCMQDGQQPLSLMTVNRGSCPSLAENSPMVFIQPSFLVAPNLIAALKTQVLFLLYPLVYVIPQYLPARKKLAPLAFVASVLKGEF